MVDVRMPDGVVVRFPDDMPRDEIRDRIATKFPQVAQQQQAQAKVGPAPMPLPLPSFRRGNQEIIPPIPRPRPTFGASPSSESNQSVYTIQAPDGRKIQVRAGDEETAIHGAQEWVAANPIKSPASGPAASDLTLQQQQALALSRARQRRTDASGSIPALPPGFQLEQPGQIEVQVPGGTARFPAGMPQADIEAVLQREYPPTGSSGASPTQARLDQLGEGIRRAHAAGNTADVQALGTAYRDLERQISQQSGNGQITITIEGRPVKVDRAFLNMSPEQQNQTVDEIAGSLSLSPKGNSSGPRFPGVPVTDPALISQLEGQKYQPGGGKLQEFRNQYPEYADMGDQQLADAVYRKFYSDMPREQFDTQVGLTPVGPSQEWLKQNPSLADLPIPGTSASNGNNGRGPVTDPSILAQLNEPTKTGGFNNATAGLNEAIYGTLGFPVDAANTALRMGAAGINAIAGTDIQLPEHTAGGRQSIADTFEKAGVNDPANVEPANNFERSLRAGGQGAGYAIAPELMFSQLSKLGIVGQKAQQLVNQIFGEASSVRGTTANLLSGAGGGIGAEAAMQTVPDEYKGLAAIGGGVTGSGVGALVTQIPRLAGATTRAAGDFIAPFTQAGRDRMAGQQLRNAADSPGAVIDSIVNAPTELVPGSRSTLFQQSGDMGIGALERGVATRNPAQFQQRRANQNAARLEAIENLQPTGAPETIVGAVRAFNQQIDDELEAAVSAATVTAQGKVAALGQGASPDVAGGNIRNSLEVARAAAKERERALWQAVDPNGSLSLSARSTKNQVQRIIKEMPASAKPPEGEEAAIMNVARQYSDTMPFQEITALQSRIKTQMRAERLAGGETPSYRRLTQLNSGIQQDLETAIASTAQEQARAVKSGIMSEDETLAANLQRIIAGWRSERYDLASQIPGQNFGAGTGAAGQLRAPTVPAAFGGQGQGRGGFSDAPRYSGIPTDAAQPSANFDQAALERLTSARQSTKQRVETFDNGTLAPIRRRPGTTSPYDMPVSTVPAQIFNPSPKSVDALRSYRTAVGDQQALPQLQDYAVDRLRKVAMRDDGTFDPNKVAAWRRSHADVLKAFPQLDASFSDAARASETLGAVVASKEAARAETQRSILGRIMGLNSPDEVALAVGSIFGRKDSQSQMAKLRAAMQSNPQAQEGLKRSVVDYVLRRFVSNTEAATSGLGTIKSDQLQTFIGNNKGALRLAGFTDDEVKMMDRIAEDLQRANRSTTAVKLPGQSNTQQDAFASGSGKDTSILLKIIMASVLSGGGVGLMSNSIAGAATTVGAGLIGAMRQKGIGTVDDLVRDALLNPDRAAALMMRVPNNIAKQIAPTFAQKYRRAAVASMGASITPKDGAN